MWLKVVDGSVIKLGQATQFAVGQANFRKDEQARVLDATFHVLKGAFRFTRAFFSNEPAQRNVGIQVGAITAGIYGADIWDRSTDEEDFVALLDGRIKMTSPRQEAISLDRPLARYRKANGKAVDPVIRVDSSAINEFTAETELNDTLGVADGVGNYALVLLSLSDDQLVEAAIRRFHEAGYAVQARIVDVAGKLHTRIQLEGLIHKA